MSDTFYAKAAELERKGVAFATAVIVRAEKPTSAKPGDKAIVTPDGDMFGWIGGSCAQPTVSREAMAALADGEARLVRLTTNPEAQMPRPGVVDLPMTCFSGGTLEIYIEPFLPPPRLLVVGSSPITQALVRLGKVMEYVVIGVDPTAQAGEADTLITDLAQMGDHIGPTTYVVVASHGKYDEAALEIALRSQAAYIALVSSKKRAGAVVEYLAAQGIAETDLARLKYPAGLDIQARQGNEIALSIMAEIVRIRRSSTPVEHTPQVGARLPREAIDPVCGMEVQIENATYVFEHAGTTYYFCCPGCRGRFAKNPAKFLDQPAPTGEAIDPICGMSVDIPSAVYMSEYAGIVYYFCAAGCKLTFDKAPAQHSHAAYA